MAWKPHRGLRDPDGRKPDDRAPHARRHRRLTRNGMSESTPETRLPPVLTGRRALIVGVANDRSIAWGCARAMRRAGAELALTSLSEKARRHVEPLAGAWDAPIFMP